MRRLLLASLIVLTAIMAACHPIRDRINPAPGFHILPVEGNVKIESTDFTFDVQDWITLGIRSFGDNWVTATYQLYSETGESLTVALPWAALTHTDLNQDISVTLNDQSVDWKLLALPDFYGGHTFKCTRARSATASTAGGPLYPGGREHASYLVRQWGGRTGNPRPCSCFSGHCITNRRSRLYMGLPSSLEQSGFICPRASSGYGNMDAAHVVIVEVRAGSQARQQ